MTTTVHSSNKQFFTITIEETLAQSFSIEASSLEEALKLCSTGYRDSQYIVDGDASVQDVKVGYYDKINGKMNFQEL